MNSVRFNISSGAAPFQAELLGSELPILNIPSTGIYQFDDVPNGAYTLRVVDANGCEYEQDILVDPFVTTTTTTVLPDDVLIIGNTQDNITIFNPVATNRNSRYSGFPDPDVVELYLWFKTTDGLPLTGNKTMTYTIEASGLTADSQFEFVDVSDEIHLEIQETSTGPTSPLTGNLLFKTGFIESYFRYTYYRGAVDKDFVITISSPSSDINDTVETAQEAGTIYGVDDVSRTEIILVY